jgi:hypothetical protein
MGIYRPIGEFEVAALESSRVLSTSVIGVMLSQDRQESASNSISMMHTRRGAPAHDKTPLTRKFGALGVFGAGAAGGSERSDRV